ncbi:hypothetical protein [Bordetella sp. 15P40C-2]|uniref:hypothetical protein n=1 Tax=Bordetella sp. 15P40C-2 TaxID=2572246 RepID=UPI001326FA18|nr:hypothetical protein [Bordetella sp. 15P40C-2]MVW72117.1 hypothetical protein [Bordetella sp. 15P40C-2]
MHFDVLTEYIVVVALVALASVAAYQNFGDVLRTQTSAMAHTLAGEDNTGRVNNAGTLATNAVATGHTLKTYGKPTVTPGADKTDTASSTQTPVAAAQ